MNEARSGHPFHMYDAIRAQPEAFRDVAHHSAAAATDFAAGMDPDGRIFLVGTGTSYHAALMGEHLFRLLAAGVRAEAVAAFDFALYGPALTPADTVVVISHRGSKTYSVASRARAQAAGCRTAMICGQGAPLPDSPPAAVFPTVPQEKSSAHTVSYTGAVAALSALAAAAGRALGAVPALADEALTAAIPDALRRALDQELHVAAAAGRHAGCRRIWLAGAGPDAVTATEAALKIKETSYLQAEGMAVESLLHGPFQCTGPDDLFVAIASGGPGTERLAGLAEMAADIGARCLWVGAAAAPADCVHIPVPEAPEPFHALTALIPVQLFAYHLALTRGTDPDGFRLGDPRFARAGQRARL